MPLVLLRPPRRSPCCDAIHLRSPGVLQIVAGHPEGVRRLHHIRDQASCCRLALDGPPRGRKGPDKDTGRAARLCQAVLLQFRVGKYNGGRIHAKLRGELTHRGKPAGGCQVTRCDCQA